jgi:hypothetical protein
VLGGLPFADVRVELLGDEPPDHGAKGVMFVREPHRPSITDRDVPGDFVATTTGQDAT